MRWFEVVGGLKFAMTMVDIFLTDVTGFVEAEITLTYSANGGFDRREISGRRSAAVLESTN